jgi:hypothetical protein
MNIDRNLANRALFAVGQEPLNQDDVTNKTSKWRIVKEYYLTTFLEALTEVAWTGGKKRSLLTQAQEIENYTQYSNLYRLPLDCAYPLELQNNDYFIVEGRYLYCDTSDAVLLYVSNGRKELTPSNEEEEPEEDFPEYDPPEYEPKFYEFLEKMLAAKMAMKFSGKVELYNLLFQSAMIVKSEARKASLQTSAAKKNGNKWWTEE